MSWFIHSPSGRIWVPIWIVVLFIGLLPIPPVADLIIVVGLVSHMVCFAASRIRGLATLRALGRTDKAQNGDYHQQARRRSSEAAIVAATSDSLTWH